MDKRNNNIQKMKLNISIDIKSKFKKTTAYDLLLNNEIINIKIWSNEITIFKR